MSSSLQLSRVLSSVHRHPGRPALRRRALFFLLLVPAILLLADGLKIQAKAWLAQTLLARSWIAIRAGENEIRPWPWADTRPVGRLRVPRLAIDQLVLEHASGRNLAFGPTHVAPSASPGAPGHVVLSGHRDTHFRFLGDLRSGDTLLLAGPERERIYRVAATRIIDSRRESLLLAPEDDHLSLVTCYPFDAISPGGPLRYVVHALAVTGPDAPQ
ncbi:MAG: class GN sortase [Xanthomonadales bacterium]|nr:class GN sortase [Xanthomonadales bacterium]